MSPPEATPPTEPQRRPPRAPVARLPDVAAGARSCHRRVQSTGSPNLRTKIPRPPPAQRPIGWTRRRCRQLPNGKGRSSAGEGAQIVALWLGSLEPDRIRTARSRRGRRVAVFEPTSTQGDERAPDRATRGGTGEAVVSIRTSTPSSLAGAEVGDVARWLRASTRPVPAIESRRARLDDASTWALRDPRTVTIPQPRGQGPKPPTRNRAKVRQHDESSCRPRAPSIRSKLPETLPSTSRCAPTRTSTQRHT